MVDRRRILRAAESAPRRRLPSRIDPTINEKLDHLISGRWTADDLIEMQMDEISTSAAVGTGTDRQLGGGASKLFRSYEDYLARTGKKKSRRTLDEYLDESSPGLSEALYAEVVACLESQR